MMPLSADKALDAYFLEARCRLLDLAAILDRIDRGGGMTTVAADPRIEKIRRAVETLLANPGDRAERIQQIFSQEYDPGWVRPAPR